MKDVKRRQKILLSILLLLVSVSCFLFMPPRRMQTVTQSTIDLSGEQRTEQLVKELPSFSKLLELLGIGALILAVWIWRKELGVTQLGPLGGPGVVTQQEAGELARLPDESRPPLRYDLNALRSEMEDTKTKKSLEHIMEMFNKAHSVNVSQVARELGISMPTAKTYLYLLTKTGQLRADGFPKQTIYTPVHSLENRILDAVRQQVSKTHSVVSERRYVRIRMKYEVDALLESNGTTFVIETKILRKPDIVSRLDQWILQLLNVAKEMLSRRVVCILAVVCLGDANAADVRKQLSAFTFDSGTVPVQVMVFSEEELAE